MVDLSGERLSDERLAEIAGGVWHRMPGTIEVAEMVAELQRHRAAQRAAADRVRSVVRDAVLRGLVGQEMHRDIAEPLAKDIADRVAAELASSAPASAVPRDRYCARDGSEGCELHPRGCPGQISAPASAPVLSAEMREDIETLRTTREVMAEFMSLPEIPRAVAALDRAIDRLRGGGR